MISISLCMIVKNEEDVLARCLDSVKDIADEIVIVDTGSTDRTKEIAKSYTDKIHEFEWIDDFSAARNYSFEKAAMDYVLWLDADDIILEEDRKKFIRLKKDMNEKIDIVMMKYNTGFDQNDNVTFSYYRERLIKRTSKFKWREPVHEYIQTGGNIIKQDICITHKKEKEASSDRNLLIYEKLLSEGKELSIRGLYYYARELYYNEKYDGAIKYFNSFLASEKGWIEDNINACLHLSICYSYANDKKNKLKALLKSFEYDTPRAEICCHLGSYYLNEVDYKRAIFWYELATKLKKPVDNWGFIAHDYWEYIPNIQLCLCYDKIGDIEQAIKYNNIAAQYKPNDPAVLYNKNYFKNIIANTNINQIIDKESKEHLDIAEKLIMEGQDKKAAYVYEKLLNNTQLYSLANFRLGEIANRNREIERAYFYHKRAFELDKELATKILDKTHPHNNYEYSKVEEVEVKKCPLCEGNSELHSCYNMITNIDQIYGFDPIRKWRICRKCNHIFAENYPLNLDVVLSSTAPNYHMQPNVRLFSTLSSIISNLKSFVSGNKLLEVGVGAGEMISVAKEMLFDVTGLDIRPAYAKNVSERFSIPVFSTNIMRFETNELFDVIILGDIIEHLPKPTEMLKKCSSLLNKNGVFWISTPNFESAFSHIMKDKDPMWRVCEHLNYFSFASLRKVLNDIGFEVKDYKISQHYNGSMEVMAKRIKG